MEVIKALSSLIHKKQIDVITLKDDKTDQLYEFIMNGNLDDESKLSQSLYPDKEQAGRYLNQLKRSLRQRLVNTLFATDPNKKTYWDIFFDVGKKDLVCNFLWNKERGRSAAIIAHETLLTSMKYECTEFSYSLSKRLANHYALIVTDPVKYKKYRSLNHSFLEKLNWEAKAEDYYFNLHFFFRKKKTVDKELIERAESYCRELSTAPANISWNFEFIRTLVDITLGKLKNDGTDIVQAFEKSIDYFGSLKIKLPNRPIRSLHFHVLPAYIQAQKFDSAVAAITTVKSLIPKTGYNWIAIHQYETIVGFYMNDLPRVSKSIKELKKSRLSSRIREELRVYETYYSFLSGGKARMGTFLNDTPKFSLDKKGMNINRVILRMLILLSRNDRSAIIDQAESLELYAYRYLTKDPTTRRSQLFLRLLFLTVRHSFDWVVIEKQTAKTFTELQQTPRHLSTIDIEVVPYEVLWKKVSEMLS